MVSQPIKREEAERRIAAVEDALRRGHPPPGVTPPPGMVGAIRAAVTSEGTGKRGSGNDWLRAAIRVLKRNPDWTLYSPVETFVPSIEVPDGFKLKGTSTLYDSRTGKPKIAWIKTEADRKRQEELYREWTAALIQDVPRIGKTAPPKGGAKDKLIGYPIGDHHLGMLAWQPEAGQHYNIGIAENRLRKAVDYLVDHSDACANALLVFLGDYLHYDSLIPETPTNKHALDADGRAPKMIAAGVRLMRYCVERVKEKHANVTVIIAKGNHDPVSSIWLQQGLTALYEQEKRVTIDASPADFHYYAWGRNLFGIHHGHGAKPDRLPGIMAADQPEAWGQTAHRTWWIGHEHHKMVRDADYEGCTVERFRILAPNDAWAQRQGYRPKQAMHAIVYHREHGEISRLTVRPEMIE